MQNKWKYTALGGLIGFAVSIVLVSPGIMASVSADEPLKILTENTQQLVDRFEGNAEFFKPNWTVEDTVSTEVLSTQSVRKIEAGRTSFVTVATTATGVYSSDGLTSPNVRYPGIHAEHRQGVMLAFLTGGGWSFFTPVDAGSFVSFVPTDTGGTLVSPGGTCHAVSGSVYC